MSAANSRASPAVAAKQNVARISRAVGHRPTVGLIWGVDDTSKCYLWIKYRNRLPRFLARWFKLRMSKIKIVLAIITATIATAILFLAIYDIIDSYIRFSKTPDCSKSQFNTLSISTTPHWFWQNFGLHAKSSAICKKGTEPANHGSIQEHSE